MASSVFPSTTCKKRRIMIITGDESVIEQIRNSQHSSLIKSCILELQNDDKEPSHTAVKRNYIKKKKYSFDVNIESN